MATKSISITETPTEAGNLRAHPVNQTQTRLRIDLLEQNLSQVDPSVSNAKQRGLTKPKISGVFVRSPGEPINTAPVFDKPIRDRMPTPAPLPMMRAESQLMPVSAMYSEPPALPASPLQARLLLAVLSFLVASWIVLASLTMASGGAAN